MSDIHDRFKDMREDKISAKSFFKALGSASSASGLGRRVYASADHGSQDRTQGHVPDQPLWQGQIGERRTYDAKAAPPQVPPINSSSDVLRALGSNQVFDPWYAVAVLQAFVQGQLELGRTEKEVVGDMNDLQGRLGQYGDAFTHVREQYRLDHGIPPPYTQRQH